MVDMEKSLGLSQGIGYQTFSKKNRLLNELG